MGKSLLFLVDSGINTAALYPQPGGQALRALQSSQHVNMSVIAKLKRRLWKLGAAHFAG